MHRPDPFVDRPDARTALCCAERRSCIRPDRPTAGAETARMRRARAAWMVSATMAGALAAPALQAAPLDVVVRSALTDYPTIRAAQASRNVAGFRIEEARGRHLPTFDIAAAGRVAGAATTQPLPRARLNLYAGGSIDSSIERETQRAAALENREAVTRDDVAFETTRQYLRVLRAARLVGVSEANLGRHQRLAEDFEQIVRIDVGRRFDLVQAQARVLLVRGTLEDRNAELNSARQALARFYPKDLELDTMGLPAVATVAVEPAAPIGDQSHPSVLAARRDLLAAEANARTVRQQRRPRLDLEAVGGRDPLSQVVLSWPAFDASLQAAEQGAAAEQLVAEATLQDVEITIAEARRQAEQDFAAAGRRIVQAQSQVTLASELVAIYYEQFRVGRRNLLDLLSAYAELSNGEANLAGAEVDRALARYRIAYTTGQFAPRFDGPFAALPTLPPPAPASVPPFRRPASELPGLPAAERTPAPLPPATIAPPGPAPAPGTRVPRGRIATEPR
jgi:outer membrane protein, adhesin transport system